MNKVHLYTNEFSCENTSTYKTYKEFGILEHRCISTLGCGILYREYGYMILYGTFYYVEWKYNVFDILINISWGKVSKFQLKIYKSTYAKLCALKIKKKKTRKFHVMFSPYMYLMCYLGSEILCISKIFSRRFALRRYRLLFV